MQNYLLADKQDITRMGLEMLISKMDNAAISTVSNKSDLIIRLSEFTDAVVVLDYTLFDFATADELMILSERFPKARIVLFSEELTSDFLHKMLFCNAISVVLKYCTAAEISWALQCATHGDRFVCNDVTNQLLKEKKQEVVQPQIVLTKSECSILKEIAAGKSTKEIALEKNLSFHTVNTHRKNIFRKLGVNNVHEATKYAMRAGIIDITDYYI